MPSRSKASTATGPEVDLARALAREERISAALREVGQALGTTLDLDDLLELILDRLTDLLEADRSTLYLVEESTGDLVSRLVIGEKVRSIRVKVGHGIAGTVAKTGKPIRVKDAYKDPSFESAWDTLTNYRTTTLLAAPLKNHLGRTIGVIQVLNKKSSGEFTDEDEAILMALSTQAAVAIDNSRLFLKLIQKNRQLLDTKEQLERSVSDLQLLLDLERATVRASSVRELVSSGLSTLAHACDALGASLALAEEDTGDLIHYVYDDDRPGQLDQFGIKSGEGFVGAAMEAPELFSVDNGATDPRWSTNVEGRYSFPVRSLLAVALEGEKRPMGSLALFSKRGGGQFSDEDRSLLELVSANLSTAIRLFRASEQRERGERLTTIGRLLSQVIHDFKTPLTVISGHVQLMEAAEDPAVRAEHAQKILRQFKILTSMQREVLEFARGERSIFIRRVYLHKFFNDIRSELSHEVDGRAIEMEMDIDTKVVARFDETRIARAVLNLARNAVEAMAETGGVLTLQALIEGSDLVIRVSDTGPGIPAEIEGQLFQSFVTAGKKGGTGLGLAIVKKIVDEHGGTVQAVSSDSGVTFEMRLPQPTPTLAKTDGDRTPSLTPSESADAR